MSGDAKLPFELQVGYDQPELLGARWWQQTLPVAPGSQLRRGAGGASGASGAVRDQQLDGRRSALQKLLVLGGGVVVAGIVLRSMFRGSGGGAGGAGGPTLQTIDRASLDLQRERGLAVGAEGTAFLFPHERETTEAGNVPDRALLARLATELRPADPQDQPDHVPTLLQCTTGPGADPLIARLRPVLSPAMEVALRRGEAIRELLAAATSPRETALVVDLPGPESVAFAAGLQPRATALFTFDNWPHPRGVVPAHLTLAAVVYFHERFVAAAAAGVAASAARARVYVLDRDRLAPYANEPDRFDNRYVVKLPTAASLRARGVTRVIYVVPEGAKAQELDDLAERFVEYQRANLPVRMLGLADVTLGDAPPAAGTPTASGGQRYYWHGSPLHHWWFWAHFGGSMLRSPVAAQQPPRASFGETWRPAARPPASGLTGLGRTREQVRQPAPSSGGSRGGSWGRSGGGFGGS